MSYLERLKELKDLLSQIGLLLWEGDCGKFPDICCIASRSWMFCHAFPFFPTAALTDVCFPGTLGLRSIPAMEVELCCLWSRSSCSEGFANSLVLEALADEALRRKWRFRANDLIKASRKYATVCC